MSHKIYVYTTRNIYRESNTELIPKIFGSDLIYKLNTVKDDYDPEFLNATELLSHIQDDIKRNFKLKFPDKELNKSNIYEYLLFDYKSEFLTKLDFNYLTDIDKHNISVLADKIMEDSTDDNAINMFIEHLLKGHPGMEYGLYFSLKVAFDEQDFIRRVSSDINNKENLIYYMELTEFVNIVSQYKHYLPESYLLYANPGWDYGKISYYSIIMEDPDLFIKQIYNALYTQDPNFNIFAA